MEITDNMSHKNKYPPLVTKLTALCNGWIMGSAANPDNSDPRDYDVWIPLSNWPLACSIVPKEGTKINTFGGFKAISEDKEVDVFTCEMEHMFNTNYFTYAYQPKSNILIKRI